MTFNPPKWEQIPQLKGIVIKIVETGTVIEEISIDQKAHYLFGEDDSNDFIVYNQNGVAVNTYAALVHHSNGSIYIIALDSDTPVFINSTKLETNKPLKFQDGKNIIFGHKNDTKYQLCLPEAQKRKLEYSESSRKKADVKVRASHLLVKHKDSRRPASWKSPVITRTFEEAMQILLEYKKRIDNKEISFAELATTESDCSSAKKGGDLNWFGRGQMQPPFEEATYALEVDEMTSQPVITDSGVHLILRTG